ncbi:MAG: caspase family protein [Novosphingobium sp.]
MGEGRRIAIAIGVGKVAGMPLLNGSRSDAARFAAWAQRDYETRAFIDDDTGATVAAAAIRGFIRQLIDSGDDIERLLIYFSGHGASTATGDFWLLSDFGVDGDECINVELSRRAARQHPLGQVALIGDACRSSVSAAQLLNGRNLFASRPAAQAVQVQPKLDLFLATRLGAEAQEVAGDPHLSYGVFSRCLLSALEGKEAEAIEAERKIVSSQSLADWLERQVPLESGKIPGGVVQPVDVTPGWGRPNDWYVEAGGAEMLEGLVNTGGAPGGRTFWEVVNETSEAKVRVESVHQQQRAASEVRQQQIVDAAGRRSFETRQGITVVGAGIAGVTFAPQTLGDVFEENGAWHVRCYGGIQSLAVRFHDGRCAGLVSLPDFIATVVVGERGVTSVNYAVSRNSPLISLTDPDEDRYTEAVARWSAMESAGIPVAGDELRAFARKVRMGKHANPTLGILAAYAYDRSGGGAGGGEFDSVDSIARFFAGVNGFVPFDVAFLSSAELLPDRLLRFGSGEAASVAGGFPLMTRGWGLLEPGEPGIDRALPGLRHGLLPGLWTCFDEETGAAFAALVAEGRV